MAAAFFFWLTCFTGVASTSREKNPMPKISALVHAHNDALRIGRALDSLRACDEIVLVDHDSEDDTVDIARRHGATIKKGLPGVEPGAYLMDARNDWVLCILPNEAVH